MGSPYHIHTFSKVSTVRSIRGYKRLIPIVIASMGVQLPIEQFGADWRALSDLHRAFLTALGSRSRVVCFLEARYEWTGFENFQRAVVFDFSHPVRDDEGSPSTALFALSLFETDEWCHVFDQWLS